jgi:hypothetical protein
MERQQRIAFWFGNESEIRYVADVPEVGDYVSHRNELWRVSNIGADALGLFVVCEPPREAPLPRAENHQPDLV